ncbi:transcription factor PIF4 isoform X2 [Brachypodium distachyon]|uniref:BHLH domain-containing protein n=1 Tax=Brachypodium distachyon TaxID=15368 RepID=A0A0Q3HE18_BRADI|nr:transcription factor PIF4 isoform X2 [Brachypodium distachyon]KQK21024.1 hypothetical protein BRADI_1g58230v3 [Brachypodium distachyon]|eukprot:XP_010228426.1 transcription factor PIF4 isoform X2 [Brachypodium distachyon]
MDMDGGTRPAPSRNRKIRLPMEGGGELMELLWQDGAVVAQAQRRCSQSGAGASGVTGEGDAAAWLAPDGGGGRDLYSQLWRSIADADGAGAFVAGSSSRTGEAAAGSSFCGSNAVAPPPPPLLPSPEAEAEEEEEPGASSAAGGHALLLKRGRDELDDSRCEDADDCEAVDETRTSRRPAGKRRARAAEVHNQSERRRRDRINEKMKALQELVPHCNKSDKASILDEAIEYLKSLQLQVQIMWMTTGMAPMMFPGAHQLMPQMAMGLNPACMPTAQSLSQLQRVAPFMNNPLPNQMPQVQPPATDFPNVSNQMPNDGVCEPTNPFLHPNDTLAAATQGMFSYGSQRAQQNEIHELMASTAIPASGVCPPSSADRTGT